MGAFAQNTLFYWSGDLEIVIPGDFEPSPNIGALWWPGPGHVTVVAHNSCGVSVPSVFGWNTRPPKDL